MMNRTSTSRKNKERSMIYEKYSALHYLAGTISQYSILTAEILLNRGADPNQRRGEEGVTPVHIAAAWGNYELLRLLLAYGGDPTTRDNEHETPLDMARKENHSNCIRILQRQHNFDPPHSTTIGSEVVEDKEDSFQSIVKNQTETVKSEATRQQRPSCKSQSEPMPIRPFHSTAKDADADDIVSDDVSIAFSEYGDDVINGTNGRRHRSSDCQPRFSEFYSKPSLRDNYSKPSSTSRSGQTIKNHKKTRNDLRRDSFHNSSSKLFRSCICCSQTSSTSPEPPMVVDNHTAAGGDVVNFEFPKPPRRPFSSVASKANVSPNKECNRSTAKSPDHSFPSSSRLYPAIKSTAEKTDVPAVINNRPKSTASNEKDIAPSNNDQNRHFEKSVVKFDADATLSELLDQIRLSIDEDEGVVEEAASLDDSLRTAVEEIIDDEMSSIDPECMKQATTASDQQLRSLLEARGISVGPITKATKSLYVRRLGWIMTEEKAGKSIVYSAAASPTTSIIHRFSTELERMIRRVPTSSSEGDDVVIDQQQYLDDFYEKKVTSPKKHGLLRHYFCYLLLDPRYLHNLPYSSKTQQNHAVTSPPTSSPTIDHEENEDHFRQFCRGIFYIGKGKNGRPYEHLVDAVKARSGGRKIPQYSADDHSQHQLGGNMSRKLSKIDSLWSNGFGVVSMHIYHNSVEEEAFTREAAMIDAIGLPSLTNSVRGHYYPPVSSWDRKRRHILGAQLLQTAFTIHLIEGPKALYPHHVISSSST